MTTARDLPAVSDLVDPLVRTPLSRSIEELRRLLGFRGESLERAITERRAIELGLLDRSLRPLVGPGPGPAGPAGPPGPPGAGVTPPDLTPPPTPSGLTAAAGFSRIVLEWDPPIYTQGHGNAQTNVYGVQRPIPDPDPPPTFGDAALVWTVYGLSTITAVPSELNTRWHFWIKWKSVDGVESVDPDGGINGVVAETGQDIDQLLVLLTGKITASQLFADLATPIGQMGDNMDALAAAALRAAMATHAEARVRGNALIEEAVARGTSISHVSRLVAEGDAQLAERVTTLAAVVDTNAGTFAAALQEEATVRASADSAEATARLALAATVNDPTTGLAATRATLLTDYSTTVNMAAAIAASAATLTAAFSAADTATLATANAFTYSRATIDGAISTSASSVTAAFTAADTTISAAVATEASARATADGALFAQYTVKVDLNGYVSGFGLASTLVDDEPFSEFIIRADRFAVASPAGPGIDPIVPFIVNTTDVVEDGVTIPAGVYIDAAYIRNLSAMFARFGTAVIDDAMIADLSVSKLTAGTLAVGEYIRSTGFVPGVSGLNIEGDGDVEINNLVARGTIYASAGTIGGATMGANYVRSPGHVPGTIGWQLKSDDTADFGSGATFGGLLLVGNAAISGTTITGSGATFTPSGHGAFGNATTNITFNGTVLKLNGQIVTEANLNLAVFSASVTGGDLGVGVPNGGQTYGSRTAAPSNGTAPFTYSWSVMSAEGGSVFIQSGGSTATVTVGGSATDSIVSGILQCVLVDANGRTAVTSFGLTATHGTPP